MTPAGTKQDHQVATILDPQDFRVVHGMSESMGLSRAEVVRQLVNQGIVALRAAASAEDAGEDRDAAAIRAVREANQAVDQAFFPHVLRASGEYLDYVARRRPAVAVRMAADAAEVFRVWAENRANALGTTVEALRGEAS